MNFLYFVIENTALFIIGWVIYKILNYPIDINKTNHDDYKCDKDKTSDHD